MPACADVSSSDRRAARPRTRRAGPTAAGRAVGRVVTNRKSPCSAVAPAALLAEGGELVLAEDVGGEAVGVGRGAALGVGEQVDLAVGLLERLA